MNFLIHWKNRRGVVQMTRADGETQEQAVALFLETFHVGTCSILNVENITARVRAGFYY
jgi:hypothetical protein